VGDTLAIGAVRFRIAGTVRRPPGDAGMREAIAPNVYIADSYVDQTRLLRAGSLARYSAYFKVADPSSLQRVLDAHEALLAGARVRAETAADHARELSEDLGRLSRFLGLIGLVALLLGGVGVATGIHVFVTEKLDSAAVLRCLGARERDVLAIYLLQATLLGVAGSALGAALGVTAQLAVPRLVRDLLPAGIEPHVDLAAVGSGLALGVWVTLLFALLPLLRIKGVAPLRALRRDFEPVRTRTLGARVAVVAGGFASALALTVSQAPTPVVGLWFAAGLAATVAALAATTAALMALLRRRAPRSAPYWLRQGVANLFRPQNQTLAVTLALGIGVFLIANVQMAQHNLLRRADFERARSGPNLAVFDIQLDQIAGVRELVAASGARVLEQTPIVPARIASIAGVEVARSAGRRDPERGGWARRREYRVTYRPEPSGAERVSAGAWWNGSPPADGVYGVSLEQDLAAELGVSVGERIAWDVQGVRIETRVANLRSVDWARFQTNFFAVFEPGALDQAPQSLVVLARLDDPAARAALQRDLVARFSNLSMLDATALLESIERVVARVSLAIRFMALFAIASGLLILIGALATSRYQRARESVLLRTLGAQARTIRSILATEYLALGLLAGVVGVALACAAGVVLMRVWFDTNAELPLVELLALCLGAAGASAGFGLLQGGESARRPPLAGLRESEPQ
jgi:putative ABC transport system permease protein